MGTVELRDAIMKRQEAARDTWSVWLLLQTTEGLFLVVNQRDAALLDAITVERVPQRMRNAAALSGGLFHGRAQRRDARRYVAYSVVARLALENVAVFKAGFRKNAHE